MGLQTRPPGLAPRLTPLLGHPIDLDQMVRQRHDAAGLLLQEIFVVDLRHQQIKDIFLETLLLG
jgi:hypothetical protein